MAHGWNQYYHNSQPLSSDAGTLSGTSETDRTFSQHVESLIGHQEFSNPVVSHEAPLQNSDYQTSYCPNSTIENSSSDCVYQRYCSQTQWQSDEEQLGKDYLQRCTNSDIPDFTTDGLQTPDLEGFKQDCGMLPTPFLENYSDVSSSSDTGEMRPSCEYDASDVLAGPKVDVLAGHSTSDWFSPDAESMNFTGVNPSISASDVIFPSNMKAKETEVLCIQDIMESTEKIVESYAGQTSTTPYMTSAKNNTEQVQNDFCVTHKDSVKDFAQDQCTDISMEDHINGNVIDKIGAYMDDDERKITSATGTITLTEDHQNVMQKGTNHENHGFEQINSTESKVGVVLDDKQAGKDRSVSATTLSGPDDSTQDVGECSGTNFSSITEVESNLEDSKNSSDQTSQDSAGQDSAGNCFTQVADSLVSDANDTSCSELCFESKQCSTDINLYQQKETKRIAEMPNASISPDSKETCSESSEENTDSATRPLSSSVESCTQSHNSRVNASTQPNKEMSVKAEKTTTTLLEDTNCTLNVSSSVKTVEIKETDCRRSSFTNETHLDTCQGMETNSLEQITKAANNYQDHRGSDAQSTDSSVDTSDEKDTKISLLPDLHSEPDFTDEQKSPCERTETPTTLKSTSTTSPDGERVALTSDNNQNVFSNSESCLHPNTSSTDMNSCSEMEWNSSHSDRQSTHKSGVTEKPPILHEDFAENASESSEEMDLSTVDPSVPSTLYGEPLSGEDSSCESGNAKLNLNQSNNTFVEGLFPSDRQEPQLKSSTQLRKRLHPIVKLSRLEATNVATDSFQCKKCSHTTSTVDLLIEHHHQSHKMETFDFCESCNLYQMNGEQNEKHLCGVITGKPPIPSNHKRKKNSQRSRCVKCGINFAKFYHYVSHMRMHSGKTPYRCDQCGLYFSQNCSLTKHKRVPGRCKQSKVPVTCSDVDIDENQAPPRSQKDATQNNQYANVRKCYVKLVDIAKTNLCGICGKSFCSVAKAKKHRRAIHKIRSVSVLLKQCSQNLGKDIKKHKCPLCPTLFQYSYNRTRHLRNCVKEVIWGGKFKANGKYCCPLCQATFTLSRNRYRHIYNICLPDCINRLAKENENLRQVVQEHNPNDSKEEKEQKGNAKTKHEERKRQVTTTTTNRSEPRFKCNLCPAVYYHYSGKFRHMKKHELFKLSGKKVKYRNSIFSQMSKSKSSSGTKTSHVAEKSAKPREDNLKLTETKEDCFETEAKQGSFELTKASGDQTLKCFACRESFDSSKSLEKHRCKKAGERPYRCLECGRGFKRYSHLIVHKNVHQRRIQCSVCKKILPTIGELIQHRNVHSKKGMLKCPDCNLEFEYPAHLLKHLRTHEKKVNKTPELEETKPQQSLELTKYRTELQQLQCSLCKEKFDDAQVLRKHCLTHISGSSNQCPFCKRSYGNRNYLLRHMIKHTGDKAFSCSHCGKQFYRLLFLEIHSQKCHGRPGGPANMNKKQLACSFCPRLFWRNTRFKRHLNGHRRNSLHPCKKCGQYFGINKIKQHQIDCTETAKQETDLPLSLDGRLKTKMLQTRQMPSPSEKKMLLPFECSYCTQSFRFKSLYLRHLVSHTGVQPYKCTHCSDRFATRTMCLQHETFCDGMNQEGSSQPKSEDVKIQPNSPRVKNAAQTPKADGEAQFKCKFCTKTFAKPRSLRRHILTHNEVKPYCCKSCDSCFSRYDHLKVHQAHCKGRRRRLEICIPKVSLDDVGKGWQLRFGAEPSKNDTFNCKVCMKSFSNHSKLSRHTTLFHTPKLFKCTRCGLAFSHEKSLKKHRKDKRCRKIIQSAASPPETNSQSGNGTGQLDGMRTKILERIQPFLNKKYKYACSYCPRGFESKTHLEVHIRLHTGERPFSCDYCGQGFIRKDYLHRHYGKCTIKQKSNKVLCEGCGNFFTLSQLKDHKKSCKSTSNSPEAAVKQTQQFTTDSPPKGFPCAYCKSRFLLFSQLQEHFLTTHKQETKEPPVSTAPLQHHLSNMPEIKEEPADDFCDGSLNDGCNSAMELDSSPKSDLSKGFFCSKCKLSFGSKAGLMSHLRTHKDTQPFTCKTCKRGFWNKTLCRNHYRKCRQDHDTTRQSDGTLKAKLDFALNDSVLVFKERSKTTGTGVLQTNFSCKGNATDEFEQDSEEIEKRSSSCKEQKEVQYQCSECDQSFTDGLMLISHLEDHGRREQEKKRNTCKRCGRVCSNQANLDKHMKMHGMIKKHSCLQCPKLFYTMTKLKEHMKCHYPSRPFCCRRCSERFLSRISLCNHYREEHKDDLLHCQLCSKTYSTKKSLARHYRESHRKEQKRLENTQDQSNQQEEASTSGDSDKGENSESEDSDSDSAPYFPCHVCGKTFKTSESLEDHQLCHLGKKPHECAECGRCFYQASQLQQHQRMHRSEFQCQICGKGCVSLFALRKHKHSHGKSHPYRCSKCDLSFKGSSQLQEHMSTHREDNFPCDICDCVFRCKSSRAEHRKSHINSSHHPAPSVHQRKQEQPSPVSETSIGHSAERKYGCRICHDRFKNPEELSEHGCIKAKERPYSCKDCDKHFFHDSHLKIHVATHLPSWSKSEYSCNQCKVSFPSTRDFLSHLKSHADIVKEIKHESDEEVSDPLPTFVCPVCDHCFPSATELIYHFSTHSQGTPGEERLKEQESLSLPLEGAINCPNCLQTFWGVNALRQHHCPHQPLATDLLNPSSPAQHKAAGEEKEVNFAEDDQYSCLTSPTQLPSKGVLIEHQNVHDSVEKPFKCACGKTFTQRRYLVRHMNRHRGEIGHSNASESHQHNWKDLNCPQCNKSFSNGQSLSLHMRLHAERDAGDYRCDMCYKSFSLLTLLRQHQESHMGEVVYECTECEKAFAFPHLLEEHQQTHAGSSQ